MIEMCERTVGALTDERMTCCIGTNVDSLERSSTCIRANEESHNQYSVGRLAWYFAERPMPGLTYVATIDGYMASAPDKTKGGQENV